MAPRRGTACCGDRISDTDRQLAHGHTSGHAARGHAPWTSSGIEAMPMPMPDNEAGWDPTRDPDPGKRQDTTWDPTFNL